MQNLHWIVPLVATLLVLGLALGILLLWLNSRGKFMFLHCVALDRAEVTRPWHELAPRRQQPVLVPARAGIDRSAPVPAAAGRHPLRHRADALSRQRRVGRHRAGSRAGACASRPRGLLRPDRQVYRGFRGADHVSAPHEMHDRLAGSFSACSAATPGTSRSTCCSNLCWRWRSGSW